MSIQTPNNEKADDSQNVTNEPRCTCGAPATWHGPLDGRRVFACPTCYVVALIAANRRSSPYGWLITSDVLAENAPMPAVVTEAMQAAPPDTEKGTSGPRAMSDEMQAALLAGEGVEFRMKDGDDEVYYLGRFLGDPGSEDAFGPLDDFGTPNAGCTTIEYRNAAGDWEVL